MYQLLHLYKPKHDKDHPLVCLNKKIKQLLENGSKSTVAKPGSLGKYDYEYKRIAKAGMHHAKVTSTRKRRTLRDH